MGQRTPGPIHMFVRYRNRTSGGAGGFLTLQYLGTCVTAPKPSHEKFKIPVLNDIGGRSVPFQLVQDGENAICFATLNRFDYTLLQQIRALESGGALPPTTPIGSIDGIEFPNARGTLVLGISDFQLLLYNQYATTPSAGSFGVGGADLPYARLYYSANLRKYEESTEGTRVLEVAIAIELQNLFSSTTPDPNVPNAVARQFSLFKEYTNSAAVTADGLTDPATLLV